MSYFEIAPCWGNTEPRAGWSVIGIKECYKNLSVLLSVSPHRYNLVPMTQDFLFREAVGSRRKVYWRPKLEVRREVRRKKTKDQ